MKASFLNSLGALITSRKTIIFALVSALLSVLAQSGKISSNLAATLIAGLAAVLKVTIAAEDVATKKSSVIMLPHPGEDSHGELN